MTAGETDGARRAELYVRSLLPAGSPAQQTAVVERLAELKARGVLGDYDVHVWGRQAPASRSDTRTEAGAYALDRVSRFREWALGNDVSMASTFEVRDVDASISGESYRKLVFPTFLLAEYRDGALQCVTPHETADRVYTVADRLARLADDDPGEYDPLPGARPAGDPPSRTSADPEPVASE